METKKWSDYIKSHKAFLKASLDLEMYQKLPLLEKSIKLLNWNYEAQDRL